eukprot:jgi/Chlat1/3619/Chrsp237S03612
MGSIRNNDLVHADAPTSGTGKFFYEDGAIYEGEWKLMPQSAEGGTSARHARVRHGKGVYTEHAYSYDGEWANDKMHGHGVFRYASGASYEGEWENNSYQGTGTYKWSDGSRYEGAWRDNRMHGEGVYRDREGRGWTGQFFNGSGPGLTCFV